MPKRESVSLISLHFSPHPSLVDEQLRWWLACSLLLHFLFLVLVMNLRFPTSITSPMASFPVALVTLSELTPRRESRVASKAQSGMKSPQSQRAKATPQVTTSQARRLNQPEPVKPAPDSVFQPPPERLAESFAIALKAIIMPQQRTSKPTLQVHDFLRPELPPTPARVGETGRLEGITLPPEVPRLASVHPLPKKEFKTSDTVQGEVQPREKMEKPPAFETVKLPPEAPKLSSGNFLPKGKKVEVQPPPNREGLEESLNRVVQSVKVPKQPTFRQIKPILQSPSKVAEKKMPKATLEGILSPPEAPQLAPVEFTSAGSTPTKEIKEGPIPEARPDNLTSQIAMLTIPEVKIREFDRALPMQGQGRGTKTGTGVQLSGGTSDRDPYWGQVRARIDREWVAPPVELKGNRLLPVVLTFRLERSGQITDLEVEHPSGNAYFDEAAKRAILAATPLPPFPPRMTQAYQDLRFQFTVSKGSP